MRNRLRNGRESIGRALFTTGTFIAGQVGRDELAIAAGLALLAVGLWGVWRPGSYLAPGLVILWMALPSRPAFVTRPAAVIRKARKD